MTDRVRPPNTRYPLDGSEESLRPWSSDAKGISEHIRPFSCLYGPPPRSPCTTTHQTLCVLPNNDGVHPLLLVSRPSHTDDGPDVGIEVQLFTQLDNGAGIPFYAVGRGGDGPEHGGVAVGLEGVDGVLWEGASRLLKELKAGGQGDEFALWRTGGQGEDPLCDGEDLAADAVGGHHADLEDLGGRGGDLGRCGRHRVCV